MVIVSILAALVLILLIASGCLARYLVYPPRPTFDETLRLEAAMRYLRDYDETKNTYYTVRSFDGYALHAELIEADAPSDKYAIL